MVVGIVSDWSGIAGDVILSPRRGSREAVLARQVAAYLCVVCGHWSGNKLAIEFGRNRSSIDRALRVVEDLRDDPPFDAELAELEGSLGKPSAWAVAAAAAFIDRYAPLPQSTARAHAPRQEASPPNRGAPAPAAASRGRRRAMVR